MKKVFLKYKDATPATQGLPIVTGVFDVIGGLKSNSYDGAILVLNHVPNQNIEDNGGWNVIAMKDNKRYASMKVNPLYNPNELPAPRAEVPQYVPANFNTIKEALLHYDNIELIEVIS